MCELVREDQARVRVRDLLVAGATSAPTKAADDPYFDKLRRKVKSTKRRDAQ